ncbi:Tabersonine 16-O-methyltransferase [Dichanthelium oligosanthes]|uniref:Tabersonine 16-O-methyltransferase n=1 Tax=Dichanthelium oligosanthes TaxID=888268 RepID=A0A1E5UWL3_9POAL|nr:Tabersonine 16-O-methyltransferase [Dichanthelium oligosanthes]
MATSSSTSSEHLQAYTELYNLSFGYLKPMALQCAINLGIPNTIQKCGGSASLPDLLATVPVPEHRKPYLPRLMRFLAATGIVALDAPSADDESATGKAMAVTSLYRLTPVSRLLVDDVGTNLSAFVLAQTTKYHLTASMHLSEWFEGVDGATAARQMPFKMAHGMYVREALQCDLQFNEVLNTGMASDSQVVLDFVVTRCGEVFDGMASLVDVGGGTGSAARTIAKAFPRVECSVLDLPRVISSIQPVDDGVVEYIAGDMMDSIPPTDAVLLKVCTN